MYARTPYFQNRVRPYHTFSTTQEKQNTQTHWEASFAKLCPVTGRQPTPHLIVGPHPTFFCPTKDHNGVVWTNYHMGCGLAFSCVLNADKDAFAKFTCKSLCKYGLTECNILSYDMGFSIFSVTFLGFPFFFFRFPFFVQCFVTFTLYFFMLLFVFLFICLSSSCLYCLFVVLFVFFMFFCLFVSVLFSSSLAHQVCNIKKGKLSYIGKCVKRKTKKDVSQREPWNKNINTHKTTRRSKNKKSSEGSRPPSASNKPPMTPIAITPLMKPTNTPRRNVGYFRRQAKMNKTEKNKGFQIMALATTCKTQVKDHETSDIDGDMCFRCNATPTWHQKLATDFPQTQQHNLKRGAWRSTDLNQKNKLEQSSFVRYPVFLIINLHPSIYYGHLHHPVLVFFTSLPFVCLWWSLSFFVIVINCLFWFSFLWVRFHLFFIFSCSFFFLLLINAFCFFIIFFLLFFAMYSSRITRKGNIGAPFDLWWPQKQAGVKTPSMKKHMMFRDPQQTRFWKSLQGSATERGETDHNVRVSLLTFGLE